MATVRRIVNSALRKMGRLGAGREPRVADQADTLAALQGLYGSWIAAGAFGRLDDVIPRGSEYFARGNERVMRLGDEPAVVTLPGLWSADPTRTGGFGTRVTVSTDAAGVTVQVEPAEPQRGVVPPRDGSPVVIYDETSGLSRTWLYDGTAKCWQSIDDLDLDCEAPRSMADPEGLAAVLCLEIADMFGGEVPPTTLRQANRYETALTQRFGMRREEVAGVYF